MYEVFPIMFLNDDLPRVGLYYVIKSSREFNFVLSSEDNNVSVVPIFEISDIRRSSGNQRMRLMKNFCIESNSSKW